MIAFMTYYVINDVMYQNQEIGWLLQCTLVQCSYNNHGNAGPSKLRAFINSSVMLKPPMSEIVSYIIELQNENC